MNVHTFFATFLIALCAHFVPASAQNAYKCGDSYSQQPCADGKPIPADDARTAEQRAQSEAAAKRDAKSADAMEKGRLKQEDKAAQAIIPPAKTAQAGEKSAPAPAMTRPKKPQYFTAVVPRKPGEKPEKKKKKPARKDAT